jgi:hypothetical protein
MRNRFRIYMISLLIIILLISNISFAGNKYGLAYNDKSGLDGGFFRATIEDLDANWNSSDRPFILHTIWIGSGYDWIECGFMDGDLNGSDFHGFYCAYEYDSVYREYQIIGPSTSINTTHTFHIQRDGTDDWGIYVDFIKRRTVYNVFTSSDGMDVGLESDTDDYTESDVWNERSFQYYKNSSWSYWSMNDSYGLYDNSYVIDVDWDTEPTSIETEKYY